MAKCANGKFFYSKPSASNAPFAIELSFPTISNLVPGNYVMRYYVLFYCGIIDCETSQDSIKLKLSDSVGDVAMDELTLSTIPKQKMWIQREVKFKLNSNILNVIKFLFSSLDYAFYIKSCTI